MKKKETYRIKVECSNCNYGKAPRRYKDIHKGSKIPHSMWCPVCETVSLKKI